MDPPHLTGTSGTHGRVMAYANGGCIGGSRGDPRRRLEMHAHAPAGTSAEQRLREGGPMVRRSSAETVIVDCGIATRLDLAS